MAIPVNSSPPTIHNLASAPIPSARLRSLADAQTRIRPQGHATATLFGETPPIRFRGRGVRLGRETGRSEVAVTAGLAPGESLVTQGAELLRAVGIPSS